MSLEEDRRRAEQTKADTEYLARELAALRLAVGEVATRDYLRRELEELRELLERAAAANEDRQEERRRRSRCTASDWSKRVRLTVSAIAATRAVTE